MSCHGSWCIWIVQDRIIIANQLTFFDRLIYDWPLVDLSTIHDILRWDVWTLAWGIKIVIFPDFGLLF